MISKIFRKLKYFNFLKKKSRDYKLFFSRNRNHCLLITISFNNSDFIQYQVLLLKKYFKDDFSHCIVDNSSDLIQSSAIKDICVRNDVSYCKVPINPYQNTKSHGAAMHWAYFQLIKKYSFKYFGFLDHDIFPISEFSLKEKLRQGIYGRVIHAYYPNGYQEFRSEKVPYWSLWAGFCFFESNKIKAYFPWNFNFFSKHFDGGYFLDTGGGLWDLLYSKLDYPTSRASFKEIHNGEFFAGQKQVVSFEILDESWIHFVSLSNWRLINDLDRKEEYLADLLKKYL